MASKECSPYFDALSIIFDYGYFTFVPNRSGHLLEVRSNILVKAGFSEDAFVASQKVEISAVRSGYRFRGEPADILLFFMEAKIKTVIGERFSLSLDKGQKMQFVIKKEDLEKTELSLDGLSDLFDITSKEEGENHILTGSPIGFANLFCT